MPFSPNAGSDPSIAVPAGNIAGGTVNPSGAGLQILQIFVALTPAQVATITNTEQIFAVTGVVASDTIIGVKKPTAQTGIGSGPSSWRVSSAGNVGLSWANPTAGGVTPTAAEVYQITILRP